MKTDWGLEDMRRDVMSHPRLRGEWKWTHGKGKGWIIHEKHCDGFFDLTVKTLAGGMTCFHMGIRRTCGQASSFCDFVLVSSRAF